MFDHLQSSRLVSQARLSWLSWVGGGGGRHVTHQEFPGMLIDLVTIEAHSFLFWVASWLESVGVLTEALPFGNMYQLC